MPHYSLTQLLHVIANKNGNRRLIYNSKPIGGMGNTPIYLSLGLLPIIEYFILFNPYVFNKLGIATAIIAYIIFLSTTMSVGFGTLWLYNRNLIKKINNSWTSFFPNIAIEMVISSGNTPYRKFFLYYKEAIEKKISDDELESFIRKSIALMEEDNKDLLQAMETSKKSKNL